MRAVPNKERERLRETGLPGLPCPECGEWMRTQGWLKWHLKHRCKGRSPAQAPARVVVDAKEWIRRHGLPGPREGNL